MQVEVVAVGVDMRMVWVAVENEGDSERLDKLVRVLNMHVRGEPIVVKSAARDRVWSHTVTVDAASPVRGALLSGRPVELAGGRVVAFAPSMLTGVGSTIVLFVQSRRRQKL